MSSSSTNDENPLPRVGWLAVTMKNEGTSVTWFGGVPDEVKIAGIRFWLAGETLEDQERRLDPEPTLFQERGDRPNPDWGATTLFFLARVQLDQLVEILDTGFGIQASAFSGAEVARRLGEYLEDSQKPSDGEDLSYEIACVGEAVDLWRALCAAEGGRVVEHGFAPDGSITVTTGPDLPELRALCLRGSASGELETTPTEVLDRASTCTVWAAQLAAMRRETDRERDRASAEDGSHAEVIEARDQDGQSERLYDLEQTAKARFSVWWLGSEDAFVEWAVGCLRRAELVRADGDLSMARSAAFLMSLWALHVEFNAYGDEGSVGDWRYDVGAWVGDGITEEHLRLLNAADQLGWDLDDPDTEVPLTEVCVSVVESYYREVAGALLRELGDSFTFAHFWATRSEDVEYPLAPEVIDEIVNDESVMFDDPHSKLPAFNWVQAGMHL